MKYLYRKTNFQTYFKLEFAHIKYINCIATAHTSHVNHRAIKLRHRYIAAINKIINQMFYDCAPSKFRAIQTARETGVTSQSSRVVGFMAQLLQIGY